MKFCLPFIRSLKRSTLGARGAFLFLEVGSTGWEAAMIKMAFCASCLQKPPAPSEEMIRKVFVALFSFYSRVIVMLRYCSARFAANLVQNQGTKIFA